MAKADRRYKTIVDDQTETIITLDGRRRITYINPVLERLSEGSGPQPSGCNIDQLWRAEKLSLRSQISRASPELRSSSSSMSFPSKW
jgi:PAS domain-containing protein